MYDTLLKVNIYKYFHRPNYLQYLVYFLIFMFSLFFNKHSVNCAKSVYHKMHSQQQKQLYFHLLRVY